jgi:hypothetical protein
MNPTDLGLCARLAAFARMARNEPNLLGWTESFVERELLLFPV